MPTYYIQSGTGAKMDAAAIQSGIQKNSFSPDTFFVESGTGRRLTAKDITFATSPTGKDIFNQPVGGGSGNNIIISPTPSKSPDGAVSSSDVATGAATGSAVNTAANSIGASTLPSWAREIINSNNEILAQGKNALKLSFDAALAANNSKYASLFGELNTQHKNASQAGAALAAQLNPYSDPRISSATGGYLQTIDEKYQAQAEKLQGQMNAAQQQLQAGFYENYTKLISDAQKENNQFVVDMQKYQLDVFNSLKQEQQFKQSLDVQKENLALSRETKSADDFRSYLTSLSGSPELQADVSSYLETGEISPGLKPIIETGRKAGYSPQESVSIFQYQTDSVRKQQQLEDYRNAQLVLAQQRTAAAADRATNAQLSIATTQAILSAQSDMRSKGIQPGSVAWAVGTASATGSSPKGLTATQVGRYTQLGVLANQLTGLKKEIDKINEGDPLWSTLQTYAGRDVTSVTSPDLAALNARLTSLSGVIGKTFYGEAGNLSNTDIQRVLNSLPTGAGTKELRNALYAGLLTVAKDNAVLTLENDAQAGYQVSTYSDSIQRIAGLADDALKLVGTGKSTGGGFDYEAWKKENGL